MTKSINIVVQQNIVSISKSGREKKRNIDETKSAKNQLGLITSATTTVTTRTARES